MRDHVYCSMCRTRILFGGTTTVPTFCDGCLHTPPYRRLVIIHRMIIACGGPWIDLDALREKHS